MNHVTALFLDLVNILGGFLLGAVLLADLPRVGPWLGRGAAAASRFTAVVGVLALVAGGYYLIAHLVSGPHVFHFELVGIGIGISLLRDRLFPGASGSRQAAATLPLAGATGSDSGNLFYDPRTSASPSAPPPGSAGALGSAPTGGALLLAVFGLIAILVGIQGLFTPDS